MTQVYLSWSDSNAVGIAPRRQLVGVQRTFIKSGESATVSDALDALYQDTHTHTLSFSLSPSLSAQLIFTVTGREMQVWTNKWEVLPGKMNIFVGGQQPHQVTMVPSNILTTTFQVSS